MNSHLLIKANLIEKISNLEPFHNELLEYAKSLNSIDMLNQSILDILKRISFNHDNIHVLEKYIKELSIECCSMAGGDNIFLEKFYLYMLVYSKAHIDVSEKMNKILDIEKEITQNISNIFLVDLYYIKLNLLLGMDTYDLDELIKTKDKLKQLL